MNKKTLMSFGEWGKEGAKWGAAAGAVGMLVACGEYCSGLLRSAKLKENSEKGLDADGLVLYYRNISKGGNKHMKKFIDDRERQQIADWDRFLLVDKVNQLAERVAGLEAGAKKPAAPKTVALPKK